MAKEVLRDRYLNVNGVDLSARMRSLGSFPIRGEQVDSTCEGDTSRNFLIGFPDNWELTVTFAQDWAGGSVHETLNAVRDGTEFPILLRKSKTDSVSATNPMASGRARLAEYDPLAGTIGDLAIATARFVPASGGLTWLTTP